MPGKDSNTSPRILSVGGGKGGVGKSLVAANLAVAFSEQGARVVLVDADLGAGNQQTMFGIAQSGPTLQSLIDHEVESLADVCRATEVPNLKLVLGTSAAPGAANIAHFQKLRLLRQIRRLPADIVVVDIGAGVAFNALDFFNLADVRVIVTSPQLTSVQNAYAFLKGAVFRWMGMQAHTQSQRDLLANLRPDGSTARLMPVLSRLVEKDAEFGSRLTAGLLKFQVRLIGNQVLVPGDELVFHAMSRMIADFLSIDAPVAGTLRSSRAMHESVNRRRPYLLDSHGERAGETLRDIARTIRLQPMANNAEQWADFEALACTA